MTVGVVGASARAAAMSVVRAGYPVWAVDLFADRDLGRVAPAARCPMAEYPHGLPALALTFPPGPVLYTGGLENAPEAVRELTRDRPLWGNGPAVLHQARNPVALTNLLNEQGFATPKLRTSSACVLDPRCWLRKSARSTGGRGVRFVEPGESIPPGVCVQEHIDGPSMSAQYVTANDQTVLLEVTDQLVGEPWLHARAFAYCGNIGPVGVAEELRAILQRLGEAIGLWAGLRGLWGIDFILRGGDPYPVDLNPRYTAALEVLEHACGFAAVAAHAAAFTAGAGPTLGPPPAARVVGKAIYFAPHTLVFPAAGPWEADLGGRFDPWRLPAFADIPAPGEELAAGFPVLTVFAADSTPTGCRAKLERRAAELDQLWQVVRHG